MMFRRIISVSAFFLLLATLHAQNEVREDSLSRVEKGKLPSIQQPRLPDSLKVETPASPVPPPKDDRVSQRRDSLRSSASDRYILRGDDYFPRRLLEERSASRFPFAKDYSYSGTKALDSYSWFSGGTAHTTIPLFGQIQQTSLQYNRLLGSRVLISGGLSGKKLEMHERQFGNLEGNAALNWYMSRKLGVYASGSYSLIRADGGMGSLMEAAIPAEISGSQTTDLMPLGQAQLGMQYQMTNWLSLSGGTYYHRINLYQQNISDYGLNSRADLRLTDRLNLQLYGTYSLRGKQSLANQNLLYPENNYGGKIEYRISDRFGLGAGVDRHLNPFTGKWVTVPYVYPIFYSNDKRKSFQIEVFPGRR